VTEVGREGEKVLLHVNTILVPSLKAMTDKGMPQVMDAWWALPSGAPTQGSAQAKKGRADRRVGERYSGLAEEKRQLVGWRVDAITVGGVTAQGLAGGRMKRDKAGLAEFCFADCK
jgi:hypothetical protein